MREEALAAIAAATDLEALKRVRTEHAGDRSPLALANREIGALPPQARKDAGQRVGQARGAVNQALAQRQAELEVEAEQRMLVEETVDVTLPVGPHDEGRPAPDHDDGRAHRRRLRRDGLGGRRGSARRGRVAELRRPQPRPRPPGPHDAGHLLDRAGRAPPRAAHPDQPGAGARDADPRRRRSTSSRPVASSAPTSTTPRTARCSTRSRDSSSTRASRWPTSRAPSTTSPQSMFGDGISTRFRPSYFPFTEPSAEVDLRCFVCRGQRAGRRGLPHLQGRGLDRVGRLRRGQPARAHRLRRRQRPLHRLRVRHGHRPHPDVPPRRRRHARHVRGRRPLLRPPSGASCDHPNEPLASLLLAGGPE